MEKFWPFLPQGFDHSFKTLNNLHKMETVIDLELALYSKKQKRHTEKSITSFRREKHIDFV